MTLLLPSMSRFAGECGSLDVSQAYGPPRPVTGLAFYLFTLSCDLDPSTGLRFALFVAS
jgi:hypothetical protein